MEITEKEIHCAINANMSDISIFRRTEGRLKTLYFSDRVAQLSGMTSEEYGELVKEDAMESVEEADREFVKNGFLEALMKGTEYDGCFRAIHKAKGFAWIHAKAKMIGVMEGDPVILTSYASISLEAENFSDIIDCSDNLIYVTDAKTYQLYYANKTALRIWGKEDFTGRTCYGFIRGNFEPCSFCSIPKMEGNTCSIPQVYDPDLKKYFRIRCSRTLWLGRDAVTVIATDVTGEVSSFRKLTQEKEESDAYRQNWLHEDENLRIKTSFDLTDNLLLEASGVDAEDFLDGRTQYDDIMERLLDQTYLQSDRNRIFQLMERRTLIENCHNGDTSFSITYCRSINGKNPAWVTTNCTTFISTMTKHVKAYIYSVDVTASVLEEQTIHQLTQLGYDFLGLIYIKEDKISYYSVGKDHRPSVAAGDADYSRFIRNNVNSYIASEDRAYVLSHTEIEMILRQLEKDPSYTITYGVISEDGQYSRKALQFAYSSVGKEMIFMCRSDITVQHQIEQQQIKNLKEAKLTVDRAKEAQSSFMSSISHDMRTPLNGIIGFTRLAQQSGSLSQIRGYLDKIRLSGSLLLDLINDTLLISKITSGKLSIRTEALDLSHLVKNMAVPIEETATEAHIRFTLKNGLPHRTVRVDRLNLQKILLNLLSNAVKFTPEGGSVEFIAKTEYEDEDGMDVSFIVRDTGIGISNDFLPKIYEPFLQENNDRSGKSGTGLGLAIVHQLVNLMNGKIEVDSQKDKGTDFCVQLHFTVEDGPERVVVEEPKVAKKELTGKKVLLCEDNYLNTEIAKALLEAKGVRVVCAENGEEGLKKFTVSAPDEYNAILMDIRMPAMNGYEATRSIRRLDRTDAATIPIIAMSADAYEEDIRKCIEAGMNDHLAKPVDPEKLFSLLTSYVS